MVALACSAPRKRPRARTLRNRARVCARHVCARMSGVRRMSIRGARCAPLLGLVRVMLSIKKCVSPASFVLSHFRVHSTELFRFKFVILLRSLASVLPRLSLLSHLLCSHFITRLRLSFIALYSKTVIFTE